MTLLKWQHGITSGDIWMAMFFMETFGWLCVCVCGCGVEWVEGGQILPVMFRPDADVSKEQGGCGRLRIQTPCLLWILRIANTKITLLFSFPPHNVPWGREASWELSVSKFQEISLIGLSALLRAWLSSYLMCLHWDPCFLRKRPNKIATEFSTRIISLCA